MYLLGGLFSLLLNLSLFSFLPDPVDGQAATVNPFVLTYNQDPFNLSSNDTVAYTAPEAPDSILNPNDTALTINADLIFAPHTWGLEGVHPHGDRLRRTLCYCGSPDPGTKNSGGSYYHAEYYNAQLDQTYSVNWTCVHRDTSNKCHDRPKKKDKQCSHIYDGSQKGREFCFHLKSGMIWGWEYWLGGERRHVQFDDKGRKASLSKEVVMPVCRKLCDTFVGPAADKNDAFFNGIAYFKNSIEDFEKLDDICFDGGPGSAGNARCLGGTFPVNATFNREGS